MKILPRCSGMGEQNGFDSGLGRWEIAHMTTLVKADSKGRVPIRGTRKQQQYLVTAENGGWWVMPAPKIKTPEKGMENLVADTWAKLGPAPEIDYDKI